MDVKDLKDLIETSASAVIALVLIFRVDRHLQAMTRAMRQGLDEIRSDMAEHARKRDQRRARTLTPREVPIVKKE